MQKNRNSNNFFMGVSTKKEYGNNTSEENNNNNLKELKSYNFNESSNNYANKIKRKYIILKYHTDRNEVNSIISYFKIFLYNIFKKSCQF